MFASKKDEVSERRVTQKKRTSWLIYKLNTCYCWDNEIQKACGQNGGREEKSCVQNLGGERSWKTFIWKTEKEMEGQH